MILKNRCLLLAVGLSTSISLIGQAQTIIGMGTNSPNPNAVLELVPENSNQGFLAPRLTSAQRTASAFTGKLTNADNGLLVFDTNQGQFFYWYQGEWRQGVSGEGSGGNSPGQGTTWYTGTTAPAGIAAQEGDFYINENTGDVYRLSNSTFRLIGSLEASEGGSVNNQNLSDVLGKGNDANTQRIINLANPASGQDAATKSYVDGKNRISAFAFDETDSKLTIEEDGNSREVNLSSLKDGGGTPSTLPAGNIYLGDNNSQPQTVKIQGDISIAANGTVTIVNGVITTSKIFNEAVTSPKIANVAVTSPKIANEAVITPKIANNAVTAPKIANDAVTRSKIAADVAGVGLSQADNGSLQVNIGDGLTIDEEGAIKVTNSGGGGGNGSDRAGTWYTGPNEPISPNFGNAQNGDYYYSTNQNKAYQKVGGSWQKVGGFADVDDVDFNFNGQTYSYRTPRMYTGPGKPEEDANNLGEVGDFFYSTSEEKTYTKIEVDGNVFWKNIN